MNRFARLFVVGFAMPLAACAGGSSASMTAPSALAADPTPSPGVTPNATGITITPPANVRAGVAAYFTLTVTGPSVELTVDFGDGTAMTVGTITHGSAVSHLRGRGLSNPHSHREGWDRGVASAKVPVFVK